MTRWLNSEKHKNYLLAKRKLFIGLALPSISSTFYARIFCMKFWLQKSQSQMQLEKSCQKAAKKTFVRKGVRITLMKLTPRLNPTMLFVLVNDLLS